MHEKQTKKIWKIRTVKNYPEAHNHLLIGEVLEIEKYYELINIQNRFDWRFRSHNRELRRLSLLLR